MIHFVGVIEISYPGNGFHGTEYLTNRMENYRQKDCFSNMNILTSVTTNLAHVTKKQKKVLSNYLQEASEDREIRLFGSPHKILLIFL